MNRIQSKYHDIGSQRANKIFLFYYNDKKYKLKDE